MPVSGSNSALENLIRAGAGQGKADAALIASMVHYGLYTIRGIKSYLAERGVPVRMRW